MLLAVCLPCSAGVTVHKSRRSALGALSRALSPASVGMDRAPRMHGRENAPAGSSNTLDAATGARMPPREIHRVVRECALVARLVLHIWMGERVPGMDTSQDGWT